MLCNYPLQRYAPTKLRLLFFSFSVHFEKGSCLRRIWLVWSLPKSCGTTLMISSKANSPQAGAEVMLWVMTCRDIVLQWLHHDSWMPCGLVVAINVFRVFHPPSEGDAWLVKDEKARLTRIFFSPMNSPIDSGWRSIRKQFLRHLSWWVALAWGHFETREVSRDRERLASWHWRSKVFASRWHRRWCFLKSVVLHICFRDVYMEFRKHNSRIQFDAAVVNQ